MGGGDVLRVHQSVLQCSVKKGDQMDDLLTPTRLGITCTCATTAIGAQLAEAKCTQ